MSELENQRKTPSLSLWVYLLLGGFFASNVAFFVLLLWGTKQGNDVLTIVFATLLFVSLLGSMVLPFGVLFFQRKKERESVKTMSESISHVGKGGLRRLNLGEKDILGLSPLQEAVNAFLDRYEKFQVVYQGSSGDEQVDDLISLGHVFTESEFEEHLDSSLEKGEHFRSALLLVDLYGKNADESKEALLEKLHASFPKAMIGKREHGFALFDFEVGGILPLKTKCQYFVANFLAPDFGKGEEVPHIKLGGAVYPYVDADSLRKVAEKALSETDDVEIVSSLPAFLFPHTLVSNSRKEVEALGFLEQLRLSYRAAESSKEKEELLQSVFRWAVNAFGLLGAGYLYREDFAPYYSLRLHAEKDEVKERFSAFGKLLPAADLDPFYEASSEDLSFVVASVDDLPTKMALYLKNLGADSAYYSSIPLEGKRGFLLYFFGEGKGDLDFLSNHAVLSSLVSLLQSWIKDAYVEQELAAKQRLLEGFASRKQSYLYSVSRSSYRLTYVSSDLQKAYPSAQVGSLCYASLRPGQSEPCAHCPLKYGEEKHLFSELSPSPCLVSVLERGGAESGVSTLLIEQESASTRKGSSLLDPELMIKNMQAFSLSLTRDLKQGVSGYLLGAKLSNREDLLNALPGSDLVSILGQLVRNLSDAGEGEVLYRAGEDSFLFLLPGFTRSKAINFVEEVAEVFALPLESSGQSKEALMSYCLISYPNDVNSPRQAMTFFKSQLAKSEALGPGNLLESTGVTRRAKRSEFVVALLKEAIEKERMSVLIQQIVDAKTLRPLTGDIRAALYAPDKSEIAPREFIPLAEKAGLVSAVDVSSFHSLGNLFASYGYSTFKAVGISHLAMYLSLESLLDPNFPAQVEKAFAQYHFPKGYVQFEIQTRFLQKNASEVKAMMEKLSDLPITYVATEFYHEKDSLDTLKDFGITSLKTGRTVVADAFTTSRDEASFARFVSDAIKAGFFVTATGIETEEQASFASHLGVHAMEGYAFGRPEDEEHFLMRVAYGSNPNRRQ